MSNFSKQQNTHESTLYVIVFSSRFVAAIVLALVFSFLLQPIERVLADEVVENAVINEAPNESNEVLKPMVVVPEEYVTEAAEEIVAESAVTDEADDVSGSENSISTTPESSILIENESGADSLPESDVQDNNELADDNSIQADNEEQESSVGSDDESSTYITNEIVDDISTSTALDNLIETSTSSHEINDSQDVESPDVEVDEETLTETEPSSATTSDELATSTDEGSDVITVIDTSNPHQFGTNECISVGDGAFYCSEAENNVKYNNDGVFAASDDDGDMEIFMRLEGEEVKISDNLVDDNSPYYDTKSNRVVWHTLLNDRYQIVSYDLERGESQLLTGASYNNMEPVASGDIVLWQAWVKNNWEIMMYENGQVNQLTNNDIHDVAPSVRGDYIVWQSQFADGWKVALFNNNTNEVEYIDGLTDAAMAENPRFVLVFDQVDGNGDISTVGYDFDSKSTIHLGSLPQELPQELPEPEQNGEKKALVQTKPSTKEVNGEDTDDTNPILSNPDLSTASSSISVATSTSDIVIPPFSEEVSTSTTDVADQALEPVVAISKVNIPDVVIPPYSTSTSEVAG